MNILGVSVTANGGYKVITDAGTYHVLPSSNDQYAQAVTAWIAAGNTPTPYTRPTPSPEEKISKETEQRGLAPLAVAALTLRFSDAWTRATVAEKKRIADILDAAGEKVLAALRD